MSDKNACEVCGKEKFSRRTFFSCEDRNRDINLCLDHDREMFLCGESLMLIKYPAVGAKRNKKIADLTNSRMADRIGRGFY